MVKRCSEETKLPLRSLISLPPSVPVLDPGGPRSVGLPLSIALGFNWWREREGEREGERGREGGRKREREREGEKGEGGREREGDRERGRKIEKVRHVTCK